MPRPKTRNAYETLNCRVPPGMVARISDYADLHSMKVRDVVAQFIDAGLKGTHVAPVETPAAQVIRQAQKHLSDAVKLLGTVHAPRRASAGTPAASVTPQSDTNGVDVTLYPDGTPAYDTTKFKLGKLCPRGHDYWNGTRQPPQTLRSINGSKCPLCENEGKKKRREEQRAHAA